MRAPARTAVSAMKRPRKTYKGQLNDSSSHLRMFNRVLNWVFANKTGASQYQTFLSWLSLSSMVGVFLHPAMLNFSLDNEHGPKTPSV